MNHLTGTAERTLKARRGLLIEGDAFSTPDETIPDSYHVARSLDRLDYKSSLLSFDIRSELD